MTLPRRSTKWHDPTHGRIDRDIQECVDQMEAADGARYPIAQRCAIENSLQNRRDQGIQVCKAFGVPPNLITLVPQSRGRKVWLALTRPLRRLIVRWVDRA